MKKAGRELASVRAFNEKVPSSPEVEELSSGSGDDPGERLPSLESGLPHSPAPPPFPPPRLLSSCCWRPFSGDTDRDSLGSTTHVPPPRRPSLASSPGNRLLKSVGIAGRFLGVRLHTSRFMQQQGTLGAFAYDARPTVVYHEDRIKKTTREMYRCYFY